MDGRALAARRGLLAATLLLTGLLIGVSGWGWWQIRAERHQFLAGQAEQLLATLLPCLRADTLTTCAAAEPVLRWVEVDGATAFGTDLFPDTRLERGTFLAELPDGFVRASAPLPPQGGPERGGPPPPGHPPPHLTFDFEPRFAARLESQSRGAFVLSSLTGVGLLVAAVALHRTQLRAERAEAASARHRELAAMGEMSAVLAHEIRNPVASMLGNAQLLAEEVDNEQVRHIVASARRLRTLTEDLLAFARTGQIRRELTDPLAPARAALRDRGTLVATDVAPWPLDAARVEQILANLVDNAPGPVELGVTVGRTLVYTVRDHGPGLPEGDPERLFAPFYTTRAQGTGLGLAVVRRLVHAHGGTVTAANHPDGGALFTVVLPRGSD